MTSRRSFMKLGAGAIAAGITTSMPVLASAGATTRTFQKPFKLRFALASDGHYGEPKTDFEKTHSNIIQWLNREHERSHLDFIIFNGDLVHNDPGLLAVLKQKHLSKLHVPYYAIPGNHDYATTAQWKEVFGYEDNYSFEKNSIGFVLANTSNPKGEYVCPDHAFIGRELEKFKDHKTVFLVLHIPPHRWTPDQDFFEECAETLALIERFKNVKAAFHGHDHLLDSVFYTGSKRPHFFDAHYGGSWGTDYYGYRVVEIDDLEQVHTYQVNASGSPVLNSTSI